MLCHPLRRYFNINHRTDNLKSSKSNNDVGDFYLVKVGYQFHPPGNLLYPPKNILVLNQELKLRTYDQLGTAQERFII